jgi:hypothetical protein
VSVASGSESVESLTGHAVIDQIGESGVGYPWAQLPQA